MNIYKVSIFYIFPIYPIKWGAKELLRVSHNSYRWGSKHSTMWGPRWRYVCCLIDPIDYSYLPTINQSYCSYKPTERYLWGPTLYRYMVWSVSVYVHTVYEHLIDLSIYVSIHLPLSIHPSIYLSIIQFNASMRLLVCTWWYMTVYFFCQDLHRHVSGSWGTLGIEKGKPKRFNFCFNLG